MRAELGGTSRAQILCALGAGLQLLGGPRPGVVRALHVGPHQGSWDHPGAPPVRATLHPVVIPGICLTPLTPASGPGCSMDMTMSTARAGIVWPAVPPPAGVVVCVDLMEGVDVMEGAAGA